MLEAWVVVTNYSSLTPRRNWVTLRSDAKLLVSILYEFCMGKENEWGHRPEHSVPKSKKHPLMCHKAVFSYTTVSFIKFWGYETQCLISKSQYCANFWTPKVYFQSVLTEIPRKQEKLLQSSFRAVCRIKISETSSKKFTATLRVCKEETVHAFFDTC